MTNADRYGEAASPAAERTILIDPNTRWVYVNHDEIVKIVADGQEFTRNFDRDRAGQLQDAGALQKCNSPVRFRSGAES